jgi:hypothetical protein
MTPAQAGIDFLGLEIARLAKPTKPKKPIVKKLVLRNARRVLIIDALFLIADGYEVLWGNNRQNAGTVSPCKHLKGRI